MTRAFQKVYTKIDNITKATVTLRATGVGNDELATVGGRLAQVVKIMGDSVTLQVFAGTEGLATNSEVIFQGEPPKLRVSDNLAGRFFNMEETFAAAVKHCILTHRFRKALQPQTIEAKILFDADKLDVTGAIGIARTLMYRGTLTEPLYRILPDGTISDGSEDIGHSFFREYKFKLEKLYDRFYTKRGAELAKSRQAIAKAYYESLYAEVINSHHIGKTALANILK